MTRRHHLALAILPLFSLAAWPAMADTPTPEQAHSLETSLRAWMAQSLGPTVNLPDRPVQITAEGDHYKIALPFGIVPGYDKDLVETATLRDGGDGKFLVSDFMVPSPVHYHSTIKTPQGDQTVDMTMSIGKQDQSGVIDTSRKTPSTMGGSVSGITMKGTVSGGEFTGAIDQIDSKGNFQPVGDNADVSIAGDAHDVSLKEPSPDGSTIEFAAQTLHVTETLDGLATAHLPNVIQAFLAMAQLSNDKPVKKIADNPAMPGKPPGKPAETPEQRKAARQLILALREFVTGGSLDESVEGLRVAAKGQIVSADRASFGMGASNEAGDLSAYVDLALEGLKLPNLPLPSFQPLVPSKVQLRPVLHGVSIATLTQMALDANSEPPKPTSRAFAAVMTRGFDAGLDSLDMKVGPAEMKGHGTVHVVGGAYEGHAEITATGIDDLVEQLKNVPEAAQAVPVLLVAKGVGKIEGDHLLWVIDYKDKQAKVNGLDMSQMMGQGGGAQ